MPSKTQWTKLKIMCAYANCLKKYSKDVKGFLKTFYGKISLN